MSVLLLPISILYLLAGYVCFRALRNKQSLAHRPLYLSACSALLLHGAWLSHSLFYGEGQNLSVFNIAALVSLLIASVVTLLAKPFKLWFVLPVVYFFALITLVLATFISTDYILHLELRPELLVHICLALAAFTVMMIASLYALQMVYLDWNLKEHKALAIHPALPSLMVLERQLFSLIIIGFGLLTLSLGSGFWFISDLFTSGKAHKAVFSLMAWLVYAVLLWGHFSRGWRGKSVAILTLSGAGLLSLAYFGSRIVRELILS